MNEFFTTNNTNQHELAVRKPFLTFQFHGIKKDPEGFTADTGVRVRVVCGKICGKIDFRAYPSTPPLDKSAPKRHIIFT